MTYILCKIKEESKDRIYKSYVTNCLKSVSGNTARMGGGSVIKKSYDEIIEKIDKTGIFAKQVKKPETAEQIASTVIARGGLKLIDNTKKRKEEN